MPSYRQRDTGTVKTEAEVKALHKNVSFSKVVDTFADLGWDEITAVNMPAASSDMKVVVEGTPVEKSGKWTQVWEEQDRFSTDSDGTKAEKEAAYQTQLDTEKARAVRSERDEKLKDTDWMGLSDVTMSSAWTTYRQALRDVPAQGGFPNSVTWPTEPS